MTVRGETSNTQSMQDLGARVKAASAVLANITTAEKDEALKSQLIVWLPPSQKYWKQIVLTLNALKQQEPPTQ